MFVVVAYQRSSGPSGWVRTPVKWNTLLYNARLLRPAGRDWVSSRSFGRSRPDLVRNSHPQSRGYWAYPWLKQSGHREIPAVKETGVSWTGASVAGSQKWSKRELAFDLYNNFFTIFGGRPITARYPFTTIGSFARVILGIAYPEQCPFPVAYIPSTPWTSTRRLLFPGVDRQYARHRRSRQ